MDFVQQMVNEAHDAQSFQDAAMAVRNHIRTGRLPAQNHALVVGLMAKGHHLIANGQHREGVVAKFISHEVMLTLATDPLKE